MHTENVKYAESIIKINQPILLYNEKWFILINENTKEKLFLKSKEKKLF